LNSCIWAFTFEHLDRRKRRSGDTAGEVEELDEEGEEEDEFGMLAVRGSSGAIWSIVPIVMFANGWSVEIYVMFGLWSVRGCSGNLRSDGAEGDELGRFCCRFLGDMTYRRFDLLKWKFNYGAGWRM
jgi:hypothetical protein